ncbi:MAG: ATP-grasp domain-containing protein [Tissierella sp.]|nr:ATP-grasp domain-containing protein [Tissierella sp.]
MNNFINEERKPVIIPTSDFTMKVIDSNLNTLKTKYIVPNVNGIEGRVTQLMNKQVMNELAFECGLTVPKSWEITLHNEDLSISDEIIYPCIVKPLSSVEGKKTDIVICQNRLELESSLLKLKEDYYRVLVQEYINGKDAKMIEIIGFVTINNNEIIAPAIIEKVREYPLTGGSTSYAMAVKDSDYIDKGKIINLMERIQFNGIFDIEFKYANGKTYFIEINFRNGAPGYALSKIGVNIPYLWYLEATGTNIDNMKKKIDKDFHFMMEARDLRHVFNGDIKLTTWIKDLIKTKAFLFINFRDMRPLISRLFKR